MNKNLIGRAAKLYASTYLAGIMGVFIYLSIGILVTSAFPKGEAINSTALLVTNCVSLFLQAGLFFVIVYGKLWSQGDKDSNAAQFGNMAADPWRGAKEGLLASIPSFLSFVVLIAEKIFCFWPQYTAIYRVGQLGLYPILVWSLGSNVSVPVSDISWGGVLCAGLPVLFLPVVATVAYYLGYRHIMVSERLMFVRKKK